MGCKHLLGCCQGSCQPATQGAQGSCCVREPAAPALCGDHLCAEKHLRAEKQANGSSTFQGPGVVFRKHRCGGCLRVEAANLATKAVQRAALALERVHHVKRGDCLATRVLGVGDGVADHVLQEHLEHAARLLVYQAADALHAAAARQAPDGRLGDACSSVGFWSGKAQAGLAR